MKSFIVKLLGCVLLLVAFLMVMDMVVPPMPLQQQKLRLSYLKGYNDALMHIDSMLKAKDSIGRKHTHVDINLPNPPDIIHL